MLNSFLEKVNEDGEIGYLITKREVIHFRQLSGSPATKRRKQTETLKAHINKMRVFNPCDLSI